MLGKVRRTTRTDVGLAIALAGITYLVWVLVLGACRHLVGDLSVTGQAGPQFPIGSNWLCNAFLYGGVVFDVAGVLWLGLGLMMIVGASRQRWSISWAWLSAVCQAMASTLMMLWAALAVRAADIKLLKSVVTENHDAASAGWTSLSVSVALALLLWVSVLIWLLYERARYAHGPSLRDSVGTHSR